MKTEKKLKQPFFAAFLEDQVKEHEISRIQGGAATQKYPSDTDDFASGITKPAGGWDCEYPGPQ